MEVKDLTPKIVFIISTKYVRFPVLLKRKRKSVLILSLLPKAKDWNIKWMKPEMS